MKPLRILVAHNRYRQAGGEDAVVDAEIDLLRRHGHEVEAYLRDNHELRHGSSLANFARTLWSRRTSVDIAYILNTFRPDVIHVHNTFALISPSIYWAASRADVPVVQTLHNFRMLCVQAMFLHQGKICEDCVGRVPWRGMVRRCYHGSGTQSAAVAAMLAIHGTLGTYREKVTRYIALNKFCRNKFIEGGLPASRIVVKPNFVDVSRPPESARSGGLYVGRLAQEKGLDVLVHALEELPGTTVDVIGTGPDKCALEGHPRLRMLGQRTNAEIFERMRTAAYLVLPSIWYENFPRVLVEAYANGLPVIASRLGALPELVHHGETGLLFDPGAARDLARQLIWAEAFPEKIRAMGIKARKAYEAGFTGENNYRQLLTIYEDAMAEVNCKLVPA